MRKAALLKKLERESETTHVVVNAIDKAEGLEESDVGSHMHSNHVGR